MYTLLDFVFVIFPAYFDVFVMSYKESLDHSSSNCIWQNMLYSTMQWIIEFYKI